MRVTRSGLSLVAAVALAGTIPFCRAVYAGSLDQHFPLPQSARADGPTEPEQRSQTERDGEHKGEDNRATREKKRPKTLLEWMLASNGGREDEEAPEEPERLDPDRPHLPEAGTTVGKGRVVLESGYTFKEKGGGSFFAHSYPEVLLRMGMFADWFEFRIGQSFVDQERTVAGVRTSADGAQDLYLGVKLALTEQKQYLPQIALIPQLTIPTGSRAVTGGKVLPGLNVDCGWEVIQKRFSVELLIATNRVADDAHHSHVELATGLTGVFGLTRQLEAFVEWDAFYPAGPTTPAAGPRHYAVGGFVYFITKNFEVDIRAGVGLNQQANDFLAGAGFAVRY
jgi:Putative MetA-pathway of phenol degradation